jgi:hypothetical protein
LALPSSPIKGISINGRDLDWEQPDNTILAALAAGFNYISVTFLESGGTPTGFAEAWDDLDSASRAACVAQVHAQGGVVMLRAGGSDDTDWYGMDATTYGTQSAQWAVDHQLDGVDFDLENFNEPFGAGAMNSAQTLTWINACVAAARAVTGIHFVCVSPEAIWFGTVGSAIPNSLTGTTGGYSAVTGVDLYLVQFYNQGPTTYDTYNLLFVDSGVDIPGTSVSEIIDYGIPANKLVIAKPLLAGDLAPGQTGWVDAADLATWFTTASTGIPWSTGLTLFEWKATDAELFINTVY